MERELILESRKFGDLRDLFKVEVPLKAPFDFKPLDIHKDQCKICYGHPMDAVFKPCRCRLFCYVCASDYKDKICPMCEVPVDYCVKMYDNV